ncbi:MAG: 30S ribosomal protein S6 [Candidatus Jettenia sp.]|nr:30S ribosomal protein S6 [Candidatus Jettenia sp. AMX1]MBC6929252.1 30S ribosomal protein S6 [Candidatus Jettenia sp.]WKZ17381.1 MAG: 30S ribosomal protein S6 [Candidatus Jettenia caeni]KAA0250986.1 MAG: 30S ribosomal protein S6 [Candidatus Jettenia sp. AMX1]MCE7880221.1 30S ribosomal protein S6 [Candidatus Jettenia sp. AMX1]MCQ3926355.1 30S ribosomal protein S6 [Candidatus Jettenia sp.]
MYEGLFLIDNTHASMEWDNVVKHIHDILQKNGAEILKTEKWGEKKLAYKIKGHKRGTYLLIHFNAKSGAITAIKRDFQLSDYIIRSLIVKDDKIEEVSQIGVIEPIPGRNTGVTPEIKDAELLEKTDMAINVTGEV